ncbi:MAG: putative amino-acid racemase [Promethearchaeota archaeon]|nr:MAG: putative amino-acid racemase [Candidatus Lokiarchaeota archaeon]
MNEIKSPKKVGLLGGMSYESTITYYDLILSKYYEKYKDYKYPEVVIFSLNFQKVIDLELYGKKSDYLNYLMSGIKSLERAGAEFVAMAANSPHAIYNELIKKSNLPIISIVEATAEEAKNQELKKLLLLGIKFTMESDFYPNTFKKHDLQIVTPSIKEQDEIDWIIFDELVVGKIKHESKLKILNIIEKYNVDGIILGCTELPMLIEQEDLHIPVLDTVDIHTNKILDHALFSF